jgi:Protein kinase domain
MVTDFGLATTGATLDLRNVPNRMATERYASPEVLDHLQFNKKSDIWALGCILFEVCTGRQPFNSGWEITTFAKLPTGGPFKYRPFVNAEANTLHSPPWRINEMIEAMLQTDVNRRPSIAAVCERIEAALHSEALINGPEESPFLYFAESSLVGTEAPIWKAASPFIEQLMPSATYRDHPGFVKRREQILDARRRFLGKFSRVTAWTKMYLAWTLFRTSRLDSAWAYLNAARNDLLEINKDLQGEHPSELVVQSGLLHFALRSIPFSHTLRDDFELLIEKIKRYSNLEDLLAVQLRFLECETERRLGELESLLFASTQELGPTHPLTLRGRKLRAWWSYNAPEAGRIQMVNTVGEMETLWGAGHSECLHAKRELAVLFRGTVFAMKGLEILLEILPLHVELYGPTHGFTRRIVAEILVTRHHLPIQVFDRGDLALAYYHREVEAFEKSHSMPM